MSWGFRWRPYVPVARRRAKAAAHAARLAKNEKRTLEPIQLAGRAIAASFWGKAWCDSLESYSDFANRLPRGRTYVRNGSVIDLRIERGKVRALVSGSDIYNVAIDITTLPAPAWARIKKDCAHSIDSLIDLLQGRFDHGIMQRLSQHDGGLFPRPSEIRMKCSCPDWATMCKHVAATLYGVGARLDTSPELLFTLRDVDHLDLISQAVEADNLDQALQGQPEGALVGSNLEEIFGIDLDVGAATVHVSGNDTHHPTTRPRAAKKPVRTKAKKAPATKRAVPAPLSAQRSGKKPPAKKRRRVAHTSG